MNKIINAHEKLSLEQVEQFEVRNTVILTKKYKEFLIQWNGGYPELSLFKISDEQGVSVVNVFNGIGNMYDNLDEVIEIYEGRIPKGFIPIGDDPGGNVICLGIKDPYYENIYFWDHEQESEKPEDMSNMYFLANNIDEFLNQLYEEGTD